MRYIKALFATVLGILLQPFKSFYYLYCCALDEIDKKKGGEDERS